MTTGSISILVGTTKGVFLLSGTSDRGDWNVTGPHCDGWPINHAIGDADTGTLWAGGGGEWHGAGIWRSNDGGESWQLTRLSKGMVDDWAANDPDFAAMIGWSDEPLPFGDAFTQIWSLSHAHGTLYAGTKPARLLQSRDGETGHCVHNMMRAPGAEDVLYQQNHHGVWRSADGGRSWDDITVGLPSTFGFPIRVHPRDPDTIWTLPLNGDMAGRYPPDAAAAVWRSRDGGRSWQDLREGLPQEGCYFTVLRQAMAGDARDPAGVYFGTNSGSVFASLDEGDNWQEVARHLPTILAVEVLDPAHG